MQAYIQFPQSGGTFRYYPYDGSAKTVAQATAEFALFTYNQAVAATTTTIPALANGFDRWKLRDVAVIDTPWIADTDNGPDLYDAVPTWATPFRYSYATGIFTLEAYNTIGRVKFERADGTPFTTTNPDGVTISSGSYYGYGGLSGQGSYVRQWKINIGIYAMKITVEQDSGTATYVYLFTPTDGASRVNL